MATNSVGVGALTLTGIWASTVYGISVETACVASGLTMLGIMGRIGLEISNGTKASAVWALFGGGLCSCVTITILYLALLRLIGVQNDGATLLGLIFFGFIGPKSLLWLLNTGSTAISKRTGINLPTLGKDGQVDGGVQK